MIHRYALRLLIAPLLLIGSALHAQTIIWQQVPDPASEHQPILELGVGHNGRLFIGVQFSGLLYSDNLGGSWIPVTDFDGGMVGAIERGVGNEVLVGWEHGLKRSTDNGASWTEINGVPGEWIEDIHLTGSTLFVCTASTGLRSTDNGKTWTSFLDGYFPVSIAAGSNGLAFAGTADSGLYRSTDNGSTWTPTSLDVRIGTLMIGPNGTVLAGSQELEGAGYIYRSTDNGMTWNTTTLQDIVIAIARSPEGKIFAAAVNSGIYRSTDDGRTWEAQNAGIGDTRVMAMTLHPSGHLFAGNVFGAVYRSGSPVSSIRTLPGSGLTVDIAPSPASDNAVARFTLPVERYARLVIVDVTGQTVAVPIDATLTAGPHAIPLDLDELPSGIYFYRLITSGETGSGRIVVER